MKKFYLYSLRLLFTMLFSTMGFEAIAHDIEVENSDGVTIYYNFINANTELSVTYRSDNFGGSFPNINIVIPSSVTYNGTTYPVTSIGECAFYTYDVTYASGLASVTIPNSVTSIGSSAFSNQQKLISLTIPSSVTSIGSNAFSCCSSLKYLNIPNSVNSIGVDAFNHTAWYEDQSDGLVYAGKVAYKYKGSMPANTNITLQQGTLGIAGSAFSSNSNLKSVDIPNSVTNIGNKAFIGCSGLASITIPSSVTSIGEAAFRDCSGLSSIDIPNSEIKIGEGAFIGTAWYDSQPYPGVVYVGNIAYRYKGLMPANTNITLQEGTVGIADGAFRSFYELTGVTIPSSVTNIGVNAFENCSGLTSISIPNSVTVIERGAFYGCNMTSLVIPNSVTCIGDYAYGGCDKLTAVVVENTTPITLTSQPFSNCQNAILYVPIDSRSNYITANYWKDFKFVTELASNNIAFADDLVKTICVGNWDSDNDGELSYDEAAAVTSIPDNTFSNKAIKSFNEFSYFTGITNIGGYTFQNCTALTNIVLPNSITTIGHHAFVGCSALETISINEGVTTIGNCAFQNCSSLKSINIPSTVNKFGEYWVDNVFVGCYSLESITVNSFNTTYTSNDSNAIIYKNDNYLVTGCKNTIISPTVKSIGEKAFYGITDLVSIVIPSSVEYIGIEAFEGTGLTSIIIPEGVTTIGGYAFNGCSDLAYIDLPASLATIEDYAFQNLPSLNKVICHWQTPINYKRYSNSCPFAGISSNCCLYVPEGKKDDYIAKGWTTSMFIGGIEEVGKIIQTMEITSIPAMTYGDATYTLPQTTNEGLMLTWEVTSTNIATVSANILTIIGVGTTTVTATQAGNDNYESFSRDYTLTVNPKNASDLTINTISAITYNGLAQTPAVIVKDGSTTLTSGTDFTVSYSNNTNAGTATVTVTGKGNYTGTTTANFTINKAALTITANSYTIDKGDVLPAFAVSYSGFKNGETNSVLTTQPTITCDAADSETTGIFDITPSGAVAANYSFDYVAGTLTIKSTTPPADLAYVDLGLPSGTKWANMNVGANAIEELGSKYAWGETSTKDDYTVNNYKFGSSASNLTKYNGTDGLTVLQAEDDAATVNMGAGWRIPTKEEWTELKNNCTKQWTTVNGISGYRFTGSNGNSIFLPAGITTSRLGAAGAYWTSTLGNNICDAFDIDFDAGSFYIDESQGGLARAVARNVRAVCANQNSTLTISSIDAVIYNGLAQTPTVTVKNGNTTLTEGTDYNVAYSDNTNAGTATVTISGSGNYTGTTTANFTINKAPLTITANSYTINQGDALPAFAVSYSGFQNGETSSVLTTQPTITCDAADSETTGIFDITPSGAVAANYSFNYVNGTLTIEATSVSITLNSLGKGTYCSEYPLDFTNVSGIEAYIVSGFKPSAGNLIVTRAYEVPAGTGLYIVGTPGNTYNVPVEPTDFYYSNMMKGVLVPTVIPATEDGYTNYVLSSDGHGGVIFKLSNNASSPANRAYVQIPTSIAGAREYLDIEIDDGSTTGLDGVFTSDTKEAEGDYYNLSGQKVQTPQKGLYIKNGIKIIIH